MQPPPVIPPPLSLDYAASPPRWRRRLGHILLLLALVATISYLCLSAGHWWQSLETLYWQRQCLNYTASPDMVVYDEAPSACITLPRSDPQYTVPSLGQSSPAAVFSPRCWTNLNAVAPIRSSSFVSGGAVVFLHERRSPSGQRYLVRVTYACPQYGFQSQWLSGFNCDPIAIIPATLTSPPSAQTPDHGIDFFSAIPKQLPNLRIYAGQPDPADPSHFTIRYQLWGQSDTVDGHLDDRGLITLEQRNPPPWPKTR